MGQQIEEARSGMTNVTSQIERMRQSRDAKLSDIDALQRDSQVRIRFVRRRCMTRLCSIRC